MLIKPKSKLLFIGDSVTDCDRARPVGEGNGLGNGYVSQVNALLGSTSPQDFIRVCNVGTSGNTVRDLQARWQSDALDLHPDWLSIMIGINDVWRQFDLPMLTEGHVLLDEYHSTLGGLVQQTRPLLKGLVLMSPYFIETNLNDPMRHMMDQYGACVGELARKYDALFVDTQAAFDVILETVHPMALTWDRIHPNMTGHMVLARGSQRSGLCVVRIDRTVEPFQPF